MKKFDIKAGLIFGALLAIISSIENIVTIPNATPSAVAKAILMGVVSGIIAGFIYGLLWGLYKNSKGYKAAVQITTKPGEHILFDTSARHFTGYEGTQGWLYLTNKRLVFKPRGTKAQNHAISIRTGGITSVTRYKSMGFLNNGLTITSKKDQTNRFTVDQAKEWINRLKK